MPPVTNLLGVVSFILSTNFHHSDISPLPCPHCTNVHHYLVVDISHVSREERVQVLIDGQVVTRILSITPLSALSVTNIHGASNLVSLERRNRRVRVPPSLPPTPQP